MKTVWWNNPDPQYSLELGSTSKFFLNAASVLLISALSVVGVWFLAAYSVGCEEQRERLFYVGLAGMSPEDPVDKATATWQEGITTRNALRSGETVALQGLRGVVWERVSLQEQSSKAMDTFDSVIASGTVTIHALCENKMPLRYCQDEALSASILAGAPLPPKPTLVMPRTVWLPVLGIYGAAGIMVLVTVFMVLLSTSFAFPRGRYLAMLVLFLPATALAYGTAGAFIACRAAAARTGLVFRAAAERRRARTEILCGGKDLADIMEDLEKEEKRCVTFPDPDIKQTLLAHIAKLRVELKNTAHARKQRAAISRKREAAQTLRDGVSDLEARVAGVKGADELDRI